MGECAGRGPGESDGQAAWRVWRAGSLERVTGRWPGVSDGLAL